MNTPIQTLLVQHAADIKQAKEYAAYVLANLNTAIVQTTIGLDKHFNYLLSNKPNQIEDALIERITHHSWKSYFNHIGLHETFGSEYFKIIQPYTFNDISENSHYYGFKKLADFTAENIAAFEATHLAVDEAELNESIALFLTDCGLARNPKKFKNQLVIKTMGNNARYAPSTEKMELIGRLIKAVAHYQGNNQQTMIGAVKTAIYRNSKVGEEIELYAGVTYSLHQDSSATLSLNDEVVELLNSKLAETV